MRFPTREHIERLRARYPKGTRVRLESMDDAQAPEKGTLGTVFAVDDSGSIHVQWDNGSTLALIPEVDRFTVLEGTHD